MAITSLDGVLAGAQPPQFFYKALSGTTSSGGRGHSFLYTAGIPCAGVAPTPGLAGAALTSYPGQIPFTNPVSGNSYLCRFIGAASAVAGSLLLVDRLWHNSGITITSTSAQTVNSVAWPARDNNGTSDGEGVLLAVEVSTVTGAGTPTITVSYTNSAGVSGRTGTNAIATTASSPAGTFHFISLQAGDTGVRSVQSITLSSSWTSGTIHLVAYRPLAVISQTVAGASESIDALTSGMPRLYDNTVPCLVLIPAANSTTGIMGTMTVTQG